ncbi:ABC transporter permease [Xylanimonas ulmi]|uniref:Iron complex transport system permease protein n=1 Tax=Xylanimonas ulmi TaxID=228973 RepID=A0A4Q7M0X4_9MICO|nr:iron chelate uptake ABC transporter family permease subunit [Xylanibacterium ulmi]RZS61435.1 iron complex transport system permease protein [Xylanibacterium ulmi]
MTHRLAVSSALALLAALALASVFIGVSDVTPATLWRGDGHARDLLTLSRLPRTVAILLAGASTAVAGVVMQLLVRNRFVEPSTVGTAESAGLGLLVVTIWAPAMALPGKIAVASGFALAGTALFLAVLRAVPLRSVVTVPLVGIMLGGVIGAGTAYLAFRYDLMQTLSSWLTGDFSGVMAGRFELLWLVGALTIVVYLVADRFTVVGLGKDTATSLGLGYRGVLALGLAVVSVTSAVVVVVVGALPFLGLVVPNVVSMLVGDNLRRSLPWVALGGAALVLVCDVLGRVIRHPFEIPIGVVMGVVGAAVFLWLLLRRAPDVG